MRPHKSGKINIDSVEISFEIKYMRLKGGFIEINIVQCMRLVGSITTNFFLFNSVSGVLITLSHLMWTIEINNLHNSFR